MSSAGQVPSSSSNFHLIINALADYAKQTGIDLIKNPFAEKIELSSSPEAILELFRERERAFEEYRRGNRRLESCLSSAVKVLHTFSGILGSVSLVSYEPYILACEYLNVVSSGSLPTCKGCVHGHRCSACCTSLNTLFNQVPVT
jgi:hypothetical protein